MIDSAVRNHKMLPLIVVLWTAVAALVALAASGGAQTSNEPSFEVATIKPSNPNAPGTGLNIQGQVGLNIQGRQFSTHNTTLNFLIQFAYGLNARQLAGGPAWLDTDKYDIVAKPEGDTSLTMRQLRPMVQKLLEDRFKLAYHREQRELSVYALVIGKDGSRLKKSESGPTVLPGLQIKGGRTVTISATNYPMIGLAAMLQMSYLDRPVVDHTGLVGGYDFDLSFSPDQASQPGALSDDPNAPPGLFTAIQEQLGLKLEAVRAPAEGLVVDHVEKPSEN